MNTSKHIHDAKLIQWISLFQEQSESGLTVSAWCEEKGLSKHAYYYWKRLAKEAYMDSIESEIVPLQLETSSLQPLSPLAPDSDTVLSESRDLDNLANFSSKANSHNSDHSVVTISVNGIHIDVEPSASDELVTRIIEVIRHA